MSHNLQAAAAQDFALPDHRVLTLQGRDALAFAQAQFMNDVRALADAQWQWNGWLSPKGRVIALFGLLRRDAETLWMLLPDADPTALAAQLKRYVFRSNVAFHVRDDLIVSGAFAAPVQAAGAMSVDVDDGVELDLSAEGGTRRLRLTSRQAAPSQREQSRWRLFDMQHGLPRLPPEQAEQWTPQQLSLDRVNAYSVKKGCYPGQEIVARTHFLGKAKRGLVRVQGTGVAAHAELMADIDADTRAVGRMVCAEGNEGLAVLPLEAVDTALSINDQPLAVLPLLDGLSR